MSNTKKKYTIIEMRPALNIWTFEVVADSEEEALRMVEDGEVDPDDFETDHDYSCDSNYIVQDIIEVE